MRDVTTYSYAVLDNEELAVANTPTGDMLIQFFDYKYDFDIDVVFNLKGELNLRLT